MQAAQLVTSVMQTKQLRFGRGFRIVAGTGRAMIEGRQTRLIPGKLLLIRRGERHEIHNTGRAELQTVNVYVPPAYDSRGRTLPRGSSQR